MKIHTWNIIGDCSQMKEENILQKITREYNTQENWDNAPKEEPDRQLYFIKHLANIMSQYKQETGRNHFFHLETFGCQMNARLRETGGNPGADRIHRRAG